MALNWSRYCSSLVRNSTFINHCLIRCQSSVVSRYSTSHARKSLFGKRTLQAQTSRHSSVPEPAAGAVPLTTTNWESPSKDAIHINDGGKVENVGGGIAQLETDIPFSSFPLSQEVLRNLKGMGCDTTFEIQAKTLPLTLEGRDVIGRAVTGSGKTLAYALPIIHVLSKTKATRNPRAIVITPTRELCNQVYMSIQSLSRVIECVPLYGGASYRYQENALLRGVDVVCATPGRLNDHLLKRKNFDLSDLKFLILDEADELLTPNFKMQIEQILEDSPKDKQMMMFSATLPPDIQRITRKYMRNAEMVDLVTNRALVPESIVHERVEVDEEDTQHAIANLLLANKPKRALVFMKTRHLTRIMASRLTSLGFSADALNSDMSQSARESRYRDFKKGRTEVLVATDVAARGLDIPEIELVIHVGLPPNGVDFYIHRSGRTGRKGLPGKTILLHSRNDPQLRYFLKDLRKDGVKLTKIDLPVSEKLKEIALMRLEAKADPTTMSQEALDTTRPLAKELTQKHGTDSLAAALVSLSNLGSRSRSKFDSGRDFDGSREDRRGRPEWGSHSRSGWDRRPRGGGASQRFTNYVGSIDGDNWSRPGDSWGKRPRDDDFEGVDSFGGRRGNVFGDMDSSRGKSSRSVWGGRDHKMDNFSDDDSHKTSNKPFSSSPKSNSRQSDKDFSWDDDLEP